MYERFTDRARRVMQLANQEAQRFNHEYIGTEHILLGLVKEGSGVAANVLKNLNLRLNVLRTEVEKIVQVGPERIHVGKIPLTPSTKKVVEWSIVESRDLNHNYVGTEHLLLGLIRVEEGIGAQVLLKLGVSGEAVRREIMDLLGPNKSEEAKREEVKEVFNALQAWQGEVVASMLEKEAYAKLAHEVVQSEPFKKLQADVAEILSLLKAQQPPKPGREFI